MNTLLDWLFGFSAGTFGGEDSGIGFAIHIPGWILVIIFIVLGTLIWLSYRGLSGPSWVRAVLGGVRWTIVVLLFVLALGPQIERRKTLIERDRVIVMLDASGSMNLPEIASDGSMTTRAKQLSTLLTGNASIFEELGSESALDVYTFTNRTTKTDGLPSVDPATIRDSASTTLGASLQSALNNTGTSPVSGIVIFSDGQSHDDPSPALLESLLSSGVPVITVPIGSGDPVRDASIRLVESPSAVFAEDRVPVRVLADVNGYDKGDNVQIELIDQNTGQTLASTMTIVGDRPEIEADLSHTFTEPGTKTMLVRITPHGGTDLIGDNNEQPIELSVVSEPMRVLYIDGHPRWEYRYLKNILMREETINATTMLLASDRRFIEEGQPLSGPIPDSLESWEPFDVVILGDVRPDLFSESQLGSLKEHIESRGCGLLWIAGEGATPTSWAGSDLASLLPMQGGKSDSISNDPQHTTPVVMALTDLADRTGLLAGGSEDFESTVDDSDAGWTIIRWAHSIVLEDLKPGVATLAMAEPLDDGEPRALVTTMRYGGGQIGYVGTDEIWRWRYGRGEDLPERFWLPMIRTLARGTIARRASPAALAVSPTRITPGNDARATLELFDSSIIESLPARVDAVLKPLSTSEPESKLVFTGTGQRRSALWTPNEPGVYSLSITHPLIGTNPITQLVRVHAEWDESANPNTDHGALVSLSSRTNGQALAADGLHQLPNLLPNRTRITTLPPQTTPLWDRPVVLALLVLLFTFEWIGRRALRLA